MEIGVLFSVGGILALNKPVGMCSQGPKTSGIPELWELLRTFHPGGHVAHRIDQFTSGVNLAGISRRQISYLMCNWHQITKKTYLAIIASPAWSKKIVDTPLKGKSAITSFEILERSCGLALVQCQLVQNGRTHQIRRHLKSIGSPIVGDRKYGRSISERAGQLLHAWRLELRMPDKLGKPGAWVTIQAPIPQDFREFWFNWECWDEGANTPIDSWDVPTDWRNKVQVATA